MNDLKPIIFESPQSFHRWLSTNHKTQDELWVRFYKKDSNKISLTYQEALEEALCFGWIDGIRKSYDKDSFIQRFTPRRKNSIWSKRNTLIIEKLTKEKRMKPSGNKEVDLAKADGRWDSAYGSGEAVEIPAHFIKIIKADKEAYSAFKDLKKGSLYYIYLQLHMAKREETKMKRLHLIIDKLKNKVKF